MLANHNRLANETSPYLLQHATNPVDWYPWSEEALTKAKQENKPILLSIGYAACHWCHVMAHESFEDEETALLMNRWFVNIKVDREERPDLDKIYQVAHQLLTQRTGGWPLTVFISPQDLTPFYTGTYFPREPRYGMPAFKDILQGVVDFYQKNPQAVVEQNQQLRTILNQSNTSSLEAPAKGLSSQIVQAAYSELSQQFDSVNGGFGTAPKFPQVSYLDFLLNFGARDKRNRSRALAVVELTLTKMAEGGIYDQIGGGFYRYSVDEAWEIPHFEKMLYDNAQLLGLYASAYTSIHKPLYGQIARETAAWILKDMQAPEGGYYATRDADSEGEEGKFYYWDRAELQQLLPPEEYSVALLYFGFNQAPNFEGHWHCKVSMPLAEIAKQLSIPEPLACQRLQTAKQKMAAARNERIPPLRDEKILTGWNGLMIKGMAQAGLALQQPDYIASAQKAVDFIRQHLWQEGRLLATYKDGQAKFKAYLDDYAFLLDGLLTLLQAQWRSDDLQFATELAEVLLTYYQDEQQDGFFFTAHDHEALIHRPKPFFDEAIPAGNGIAAYALGRLGFLLSEPRYLIAAENTLKAANYYLQQAPHGCASVLLALQDYLEPPTIVILRGDEAHLQDWQQLYYQSYRANSLCVAIPHKADNLPVKMASMSALNNVTAYFCQGATCSKPITALGEFSQAIA